MFYNLALYILSPLILFVLRNQTRKAPRETRFFKQRCGYGYPELDKELPHSDRIWIHCASVGELKAAEGLMQALLTERPTLRFILTTNTRNGYQFFQQTLAKDEAINHALHHCYCPFDWLGAVKRFITHFRPRELWIMETEIWPNLYSISTRNHIPIRILNGRLSAKTLKAPFWLKRLYRNSLSQITQVLARSEEEARHFIQLGAPAEKVIPLGNIKFGQPQQLKHFPSPLSRPYVLAASTHEDEERRISELWLQLRRPELLVIVPRHPKRSEAIQQQLQALQVKFAVASKQQRLENDTRIWLDDRFGYLLALFEHAEIVIMGGSFVAKGGHNILEPAAYGKAIITGPDMSDFVEETALLKANNGLIQCDYPLLGQHLTELLQNAEQKSALEYGANRAMLSQTHTFEAYVQILEEQALGR
ncbi:glycosyltransferase N-terminal domain-containing protein [Thiomicrorhabdus sp.]|uniref:3-deoxy-D-manno-octulosonic acid transferase n=1 Tax=Thiomicrorhabdus sp. TaxID=2039724 RepID=UPI0029C80E45|nr:glycosyltransferase N-terminal domain-containing protein [Thiomicrorhabdus sp.]